MGCIFSKRNKKLTPQKTTTVKVWDKKKPDPKHYTASKLTGESLVRPPGSLNGNQFIIEECENANIHLLDHTAQVTIDLCKKCHIFIGPSEGSVFIRDCTDCVIVVACQQFRLRDCRNLDIYLYSFTQPIIETSNDISFACFQFYYPSLMSQFQAAKLSIWTNSWSDLFDFNSSEAGAGQHYSLLPKNKTPSTLGAFRFPSISDSVEEVDGSAAKSVVPLTLGRRARPFDQSIVIASFASEEVTRKLLEYIRQKFLQVAVAQTRKVKLNKDAMDGIFAHVRDPEERSRRTKIAKQHDHFIAIELNGPTPMNGDISAAISACMQEDERSLVYISADKQQSVADVQAFFGDIIVTI